MTYYERTRELLESHGYKCGKVERYIPQGGSFVGGKRVDLFNIIDMIAIHPERGLLGVQICGADFSAHVKKMMGDEIGNTLDWMKANQQLVLIGWRKLAKLNKHGKRSKVKTYQPRIGEFIYLPWEGKLDMKEKPAGEWII